MSARHREPSSKREDTITVRRIEFSFPERLDPVIFEGRPEESYVLVGISLLLPYLEPYLIRSMREARKQVKDPALLADLDAFNAQEGQHYRQHLRFNEAVRPADVEALTALEAELSADYRRFTATRGIRWNLAYAEGFEAFTTAMARFTLETGQLEGMHPAALELFQWHLIEELEHRTVAFEVYDHVCGGYLYRLAVGLYAQWHLNRFALRVAGVLQNADPAGFRRRFGGRKAAWARLRPLFGKILRRLYPKILATYLPWYTPRAIPLPEEARALGARYAEMALQKPSGAKREADAQVG
jgi:hypothetical protein